MKHDLFNWSEVDDQKTFRHAEGSVRVRCSLPCALYAEAEGFETLVGYGSSFDFEISQAVTLRVDGPAKLRVFVFEPLSTSSVYEGETYTNTDRLPMESGSVFEVTKAMREMRLLHQQQMREMRRLAPPKPDPQPAPAPAPAPEPEVKPE